MENELCRGRCGEKRSEDMVGKMPGDGLANVRQFHVLLAACYRIQCSVYGIHL